MARHFDCGASGPERAAGVQDARIGRQGGDVAQRRFNRFQRDAAGEQPTAMALAFAAAAGPPEKRNPGGNRGSRGAGNDESQQGKPTAHEQVRQLQALYGSSTKGGIPPRKPVKDDAHE